ncbi:MAG: Trk system potassium transporter TrkA [Firmicutes bacterium]|nr:Trk system potassium transporter TrkA [Bacillota bacterium]
MKIIIVGCGKVGTTLAEQLSTEDHDITIIDNNSSRLQNIVNRLDILGIKGNGATFPVLEEAGIEDTDLLIAATAADELNLLACLIGKKAGAKNTIARVRNPEYVDVISVIKEDLGLSLAINPEMACAMEIGRVLKFPSMITVDTFAKGRVELLQFEVESGNALIGMQLKDMGRFHQKVLICAAEKKNSDVIIPSGDFIIEEGDKLSIVGDPYNEIGFFQEIGIKADRIKSLLIVGGGRIAYYLARLMIRMRVDVKIIENSHSRCEELAELLPEAEIINGDGTDQNLLLEEGADRYDAFAALTGLDEENIMLSLYVGNISNAKLITKITRNPFMNVIANLDLGSVFYPRLIAAENILKYVRAMQNSYGSNVEALSKIINNKAEALEFYVRDGCSIINIPLMELKLKNNLLIGVINRHGNVIIPSGSDYFLPGDTVIVVTTEGGLDNLEDIIK